MRIWLISANGKLYNHEAAFQKWGFIDWTQSAGNKCRHYEEGDIAYIYCSQPLKSIRYKTTISKVLMTREEAVDDKEFWFETDKYDKARDGYFARFRLLEATNTDQLNWENLRQHGLENAPQNSIELSKPKYRTLLEYIEEKFHAIPEEIVFPESDFPNELYEGSKCQVFVNKYERSREARQRCIDKNGTKCMICGFDFEAKYGDIGKGFIHVHHVIPLNARAGTYKVDYRNDLMPICPNCHAMIHRKPNGVYTKQELQELINKATISNTRKSERE